MRGPGIGLISRWDCIAGLAVHTYASLRPPAGGRLPLVLVHGLGVSSSYFLPSAALLADSYEVYVPDMPGFGRSAKPARSLDVDELAWFVKEWMGGLRIERALFVGNSLSCQIIVDLAVYWPERVERAVLVGPTGDPHARSVPRVLLRGLRDVPYERLSLWPLLLRDYLIAGPRRTLRTCQAMLKDPIEKKLPRMRAPALVVRGSKDPIVPQGWAEEMVRLLPCGRLAVLPGAGHAPHYSHAGRLVRLIQPFLAEQGEAEQVIVG